MIPTAANTATTDVVDLTSTTGTTPTGTSPDASACPRPGTSPGGQPGRLDWRRLSELKGINASTALLPALLISLAANLPAPAQAKNFDKITDTVTNVNDILATISIAVVTIAIVWAGFKMIFQGARLADVANVLIGGTLVGGATAMATYIVS
jgi:type IV secretion system protein VirB2